MTRAHAIRRRALAATIVLLCASSSNAADEFKDEYPYRGGRCRYAYKADEGKVEEKWECRYPGRAPRKVEHKHEYPYRDGECMHEFKAERGKVEERFECKYGSDGARPRPRAMPQG